MSEDTSVHGYTHKYVIDGVSDEVVTLYFSDENGNIDDNGGKYYTAVNYANYFITENAREKLTVKITDNGYTEGEIESTFKFTAEANGGYEPYQYQFIYTNLDTGIEKTCDYTAACEAEKIFDEEGNYKVTVNVKDYADEVASSSTDVVVKDSPFAFSEFSVTPNTTVTVGKRMDFEAVTEFEHIKSGKNEFNAYEFTIKKSNEVCYTENIISDSSSSDNFTSTIKISWAPTEAGTYTATISSTDGNGEFAEKSVTFEVKENLIGDANRDGEINSVDVLLIQRYDISLITSE